MRDMALWHSGEARWETHSPRRSGVAWCEKIGQSLGQSREASSRPAMALGASGRLPASRAAA
ncbi:hypothetical protein MASR1M97_23280 [Candidatus Desulfobacillus denitrificans]